MELGKFIDSNVDQEIQQFIDWQKTEKTKKEYQDIFDYYDGLIDTNPNAKAVKAFVMLFMDESLLYPALELLERAIYDDKVKTAVGSYELYVRYGRIKTEKAKAKSNYFLFNAAILNHSLAQLIVFEKYQEGELDDLNISEDTAIKLLFQSADNKNVGALRRLCSYLENDFSVLSDYGRYAKLLLEVSPKDDEHYKKYEHNKTALDGVQAYLDEKYDEAYKLISSIIDETKHSYVVLCYLKMLYYGQGTKPNQESAIKMAEILRKSDSDELANESLYIIAISYLNGVYYKKDIEKGINVLQKLEKLAFEPAVVELRKWKKGLFGWKRG